MVLRSRPMLAIRLKMVRRRRTVLTEAIRAITISAGRGGEHGQVRRDEAGRDGDSCNDRFESCHGSGPLAREVGAETVRGPVPALASGKPAEAAILGGVYRRGIDGGLNNACSRRSYSGPQCTVHSHQGTSRTRRLPRDRVATDLHGTARVLLRERPFDGVA